MLSGAADVSGGLGVCGGPAKGGGPMPGGGFAAAAVLVSAASAQAMKSRARLSLETPLRRTILKAKMRVPLHRVVRENTPALVRTIV